MVTGQENFEEHSRISNWLVVKVMRCPKMLGIIHTIVRIYGQHHENISPGKCLHFSTKLRLTGMQARSVWAHFLLRCILSSVKFFRAWDHGVKIIKPRLQTVQTCIHMFHAFKKQMKGYHDKFKDQTKTNSLFQTNNKQTSHRCRREVRQKELATQRTWGRVVVWVRRTLVFFDVSQTKATNNEEKLNSGLKFGAEPRLPWLIITTISFVTFNLC